MASRNTGLKIVLGVLCALCLLFTLSWWMPYSWETVPFMADISALAPWTLVLIIITFAIAAYNRRGITCIVMSLCLVLQGVAIFPYFGHADTELSPATREIMADMSTDKVANPNDRCARIMTLNVGQGRADVHEIVQTVSEKRIEVLALQETTESFITELESAGIESYLPNHIESDSSSGTMNAIYTMASLGDPSPTSIDSSASDFPAATVTFAGSGKSSRIRFICVHTTSPKSGSFSQWGRALDEISGWSAQHASDGTAYVLLGDFNATSSQKHFQRILNPGFRDAARVTKSGMQFTWPVNGPLPSLATIDHILVNSGVHVGDATTVKIKGTDHKAVLAVVEPSDIDGSK